MNRRVIKTAISTVTSSRLLLAFGLLSFFVLAFHIPEKETALLYVGLFFLFSSFNPITGIAFILLSIPFFLGAPHKPYFYLFEVLIYGQLAIGFFHLWKRKIAIEIPFKPLIILLILSYLFSLPINAKEYYYEFWATPFKEIWFQWLTGHEKFPFFHLRTLSNALSGIVLFIVTFNLFSKDRQKDLEECWKGMIWMAVLICLVGFLFLFKIIPSQPESYLSLSLAGTHEGALSAFAFNREYLAQYLLILFPLIFYFLYQNRKKYLRFSFYLFVFSVFLLSLSASMQRSAFLVLFLEIFLLFIFYMFLFPPKQKTAFLLLLVPFLVLLVMFSLDIVILNKRFISRLALLGLSDPDNRRLHLWNTAWNMFTFSPLLGIGLGKYYEFFPEFFKDSSISWKTYGLVRGEPHSFYFQTLAEQGAFGFLLLVGLVFLIGYQMIKKLKEDPARGNKPLMAVLLVSLFSWFCLGFFHNVSYVRSLGVLLWILLGWSVSLIAPLTGAYLNKTKTKGFLVGLLILTTAFGYQLKLIYDRPLPPFFQIGLYKREVLPGGEKIRWMGKRAVINTNIQGGAVIIDLSAPLPEIEKHAQRIRLWAGKHFQEVIIRDMQWHQIIIPIDKKTPGWMLLKIETDYTFNPQKSGFSRDDRDLGVMIRGLTEDQERGSGGVI